MGSPTLSRVTEVLTAIRQGDPTAAEDLLPLVYDELRKLASQRLAMERGGSLQATALVHEAYMRLVGDDGSGGHWENKAHFFGAAALAMRRILVDHARKRGTIKRGGGWERKPLDDEHAPTHFDPAEMLALDEALGHLEEIDSRKCEVVQLRYFAGLSVADAAEVLGVSARTVEDDWRFAKAWLRRELSKGNTQE